MNLNALLVDTFFNPLQDFLSSLNAVISTKESTEFIKGHVIYNPAYTYNFQLKKPSYCKQMIKLDITHERWKVQKFEGTQQSTDCSHRLSFTVRVRQLPGNSASQTSQGGHQVPYPYGLYLRLQFCPQTPFCNTTWYIIFSIHIKVS